MGMFLTGIWTTLIVSSWIWEISKERTEGIVLTTILMIITFFFLGVYVREKLID